jgi:sugar transferase (PEP-CTERM/EpsH1 system associated)
MRILYLTHRLPFAPNRGDRIRAYHTLRHLAAHHEVHLVSLVHDAEEAAHAGELTQVAASVTTARVSATDRFVRIAGALATGTPLTHALLDARGLHGQLAEQIRGHRPDLVLPYCSSMARFALEPPLAGLPFVLDMVDVDSEKWRLLGRGGLSPRQWIYRREATVLRAFERRAVMAARATLVVNDREKRTLMDMCPASRIEVISLGIDRDGLRPPGPPAAESRVVFCGMMDYQPNEAGVLWFIRDVWPSVRRMRPDATFLIVGANVTRRVARAAQGNEGIEITGAVPDVRPFLWRSAVSVAPLFVARGQQNKVLEASAALLPSIVSTPVWDGLPPQVLRACTRADSVQEWVAAVLDLLSLSSSARRGRAEAADLAALEWAQTLAPLDGILNAAVHEARC